MAALCLLDALQVPYHATILRGVSKYKFSLGLDLTPALLTLSIISLAYLAYQRKTRAILISILVSAGFYLLLGLNVSTAVFAMLVVVSTVLSQKFLHDYLFWTLALLSGLEGAAFLYWVLPVGTFPMRWLANLEHGLYGVIANPAPLITILALFMWFIKSIVKIRIRGGTSPRIDLDSSDKEIHLNPKILLALSLVLAVAGALYPYRPDINPESVPVGVDITLYLNWTESVEQDPSLIFTISGSRPMILLIIIALKHLLGWEFQEVIRSLPVLLNPLLSLSVFLMVSLASGDKEWASLSSLLTALGFNTSIGMYSYFLTNNLGLILIFPAIGFLFKNLTEEKYSYTAAASALASLAVFTHPWTFTQFYATIGLFGLILGYRYLNKNRRNGLFTILIFLAVTGVVDVLKGILIGGEGLSAFSSTAPLHLNFIYFWDNNKFTFRHLYGGYLSNSVLIGFAALGIYFLKREKTYHYFLEILLAVSSIYFLVALCAVRMRPYIYIPARLMYNIPFGVLSALAVLILLRKTELRKRDKMMVLTFFILYMAVYLFRSLANLVY